MMHVCPFKLAVIGSANIINLDSFTKAVDNCLPQVVTNFVRENYDVSEEISSDHAKQILKSHGYLGYVQSEHRGVAPLVRQYATNRGIETWKFGYFSTAPLLMEICTTADCLLVIRKTDEPRDSWTERLISDFRGVSLVVSLSCC